ncbi:MAG: OsmC family protein [Pseudomonadota bacterium]
MSDQLHVATVCWTRSGTFAKGQYSRAHEWRFDGGATVHASASPANVPLPYADATAVDPEEAFVAAVSSCHMLWFLDLARQAGFELESYTDEAKGHMTTGKGAHIHRVDLHPEIVWTGTPPSAQDVAALHHKAHENCFIANSIKSEVVVN